MKKTFFPKTAFLIFWFYVFTAQVNAGDIPNYYIFEEGGIDVSGGMLESDNYILDHYSLTYDFNEELSSSQNYQEITGNSALQIFCGNNIVEPGEKCDNGNLNN